MDMNQKYEELIQKINELNYHYYTLDAPLTSDKKYDALYDELVQFEDDHPELVRKDSPTQRVGGEVLSSLPRKAHTIPMASLNKAQNFERVTKFKNDTDVEDYTLEWKFDGLAFIARYENGIYTEARTRGDGLEGEVITEQVRTIKSLPMSIAHKGVVEVQGEIIIPLDLLDKYNQKMMDHIKAELLPDESNLEALRNKYKTLSNARNGASGSVRQLDTRLAAERPLEAYLYNVAYIEGRTLTTQKEIVEFLKENRFKTGPLFEIHTEMNVLQKRIEELEEERKRLNFEVDGLVIKVNELKERERIGSTSSHPKWAIAYKFKAIEEVTKLVAVTWEVGRTGRITPRGWVEPVQFDGVTVNKATLNNPDYIKVKGIKLGSDVLIRRSNDVIPQILGVAVENPDAKDIKIPTFCPSCGSELVYDDPILYCENTISCPEQRARSITHFASREAMDIEGLSEKTIAMLIENGLVENPADIYRLTKDDLLTLDGFKERRSQKLIDAIEGSKNRDWQKFVYSLGIPTVGRRSSREIVKSFKTWESLRAATVEQLDEVDDIGEKTAKKIYDYINDETLIKMVEELFALGVRPQMKEEKVVGNSLEGKTFVITGTLNQPRNFFKQTIEENGGKVSSSVSKKTDFLLAGEKAGSKLKRAEELGVTVLSETDFVELMK